MPNTTNLVSHRPFATQHNTTHGVTHVAKACRLGEGELLRAVSSPAQLLLLQQYKLMLLCYWLGVWLRHTPVTLLLLSSLLVMTTRGPC